MKRVIICIAAVLAAAALAVGIGSYRCGYFILFPAVQLQLNGEAAVEIDACSDYTDAGASARKGKADLSGEVICEGSVDTAVPGTYTLTYRLIWKEKEYVQQRTVTVVDREAPVLELAGEAEITLASFELYKEPGFTAEDRCDGTLTEQVSVTQTEEETAAGRDVVLTYAVCDAAGNETSVQRRVLIRDTEPPTIALRGYSTVYVPVGGTFKDPGCKAEDAADGDLSAAVTVSGSVNTAAAGTYTLVYSVQDKVGNSSEIKRTVKVYDYTPNKNNRIYLTFDDGPNATITPQVLDILAANDVQATFFIINYSSGNRHLVKRMIDEGHTVAIHGYSHDYAAIYANDDAFMQNIYRLQNKLQSDFGYKATVIRFPGGSSNTVSAYYNKGIMSRLVQRVEQEGFSYFDWNVSSGDASAQKMTKTQIYNAVAKGLRTGRSNVVLMHDAGGKQTTVDALQDIINYAKANNYTLLPITPGTAPVHHGVAN